MLMYDILAKSLECETYQTNVVEKIKTYILCSITFPRKSCHLWNNVKKKYGGGRQATDNNTIRRMRFTCWITKAIDTHSEYGILTVFSCLTSLYCDPNWFKCIAWLSICSAAFVCKYAVFYSLAGAVRVITEQSTVCICLAARSNVLTSFLSFSFSNSVLCAQSVAARLEYRFTVLCTAFTLCFTDGIQTNVV